MFRIKYNGDIFLAKKVSHNSNSPLIFITTETDVITVACKSKQRANDVFHALLARPWIDLDADEFEVELSSHTLPNDYDLTCLL